MSFKDELLSTGSAKTIRFRPDDLDLLRWYIKNKDIRNQNGRLISVHRAIENMVHSFCENEIKELMKKEGRKKFKGEPL